MADFPEWVSERQKKLEDILRKLLATPGHCLVKSIRSEIPATPGWKRYLTPFPFILGGGKWYLIPFHPC